MGESWDRGGVRSRGGWAGFGREWWEGEGYGGGRILGEGATFQEGQAVFEMLEIGFESAEAGAENDPRSQEEEEEEEGEEKEHALHGAGEWGLG